MRFIDTNVFLRFLTGDDPQKAQKCHALFQSVQSGAEAITTCEAVISEIVYVLSSKSLYNLPREEIRDRLMPLLNLRGLQLPHRGTYLHALDLYVMYPNLDFEDVLCIAHMQRAGIGDILSYDRGFDRVSGILRVEP